MGASVLPQGSSKGYVARCTILRIFIVVEWKMGNNKIQSKY